MTAPPPRRPWHKRKRTWAAALWLLAAYPLGYGPAYHVRSEVGNWRAYRDIDFVYDPINRLRFDGPPRLSAAIEWYSRLWLSPEEHDAIFEGATASE